MKRFTFLVHPLVPIARRAGAVRTLKTGLILTGRPARIPEDVGEYARVGFGDVEGVVMGVPLLPDELLADQERALVAMERAVQLAAPVGQVGLGSVLAVVAGRGQALQEACGLPVTTGNVATTWAALDITRRVGRERGLGEVAVLGGRGAVGRALADLLKADFDVVVDPPDLAAHPFVVGAHTSGQFLDPGVLAPGAVLVDVSLPRTLSGPPRPDCTAYAGESVTLPPGWRRDVWGHLFHLLAGYGPRSVYACLLEPLVGASLGRREPFAQGRRIDPAAIRAFGAEVERMGFRPELKPLPGSRAPRRAR